MAMEETRFRSVSPLEEYRSAVADSTSGVTRGSNSEPVPIAYTKVNTNGDTSNSGGSTDTGYVTHGYVNGGHSINFRARQAEPEETQGVGLEVDFDSKFTDEYANLNDVRNYHFARNNSHNSPERPSNAIYRDGGVINNSREEKKQKRCSVILLIGYSILFLTSFTSLFLAVFNFVNTQEYGKITGSPLTTDSIDQASIDRFRVMLNELRVDLNSLNRSQGGSIGSINAQIDDLTARLNDLTEDESVTSTAPSHISIPLYKNCTTTRQQSCTIVDQERSNPKYASCSTISFTMADIEQEGTYVSNIFCTMNDDQIMPVSSSLSFENGRYSCVCHGLEIPVDIQDTLRNFVCGIHVTRCPVAIEIPSL